MLSPDRRELLIALGLIGLVIILAFLQPIPSIATFVLLSGVALISPAWAVRALTASIFATLLTGAITQDFIPVELREGRLDTTDSGVLLGRYLMLAACAFSLFRARRFGKTPLYVPATIVFFTFLGAHALVVSYMPAVSLLKTITLAMGVYVVLRIAWLFAGNPFLLRWFQSFMGAVVVLSFPLVIISKGYLVNGVGFQGLFNHPQVFGVVCGIYAAYMFGSLLSSRTVSLYKWALLALLCVCIIASGARTGMAAFVIGTVVASSVAALRGGRSLSGLIPLMLISFVGGIGLLAFPIVQETLLTFIDKDGIGTLNLAEQFQGTRGSVAEKSMEAFRQHPLFGVGLGLPGDQSTVIVKRDPFFGLPLGASVEKGLIFTALLEEIGLVGTVLFSISILSLVAAATRFGSIAGIALVVSALASNFGEATLLSVGGLGGYVWLAIGIGLATRPRQAE